VSKKPNLASQLAKLAKGVLLPSETDAPLAVVEYPGAAAALGDPAAFRKLIGAPARTTVARASADEFFRRLSAPAESDGAAMKKLKAKFAVLGDFFAAQLTGATVFRLGKISVTTYIVGVTPDGGVLGLVGKQVET
jgi:hypothetical protein